MSTPASAQSHDDWHFVAGDVSSTLAIGYGARVALYNDNVSLSSTVQFGSQATSATGCRITSWLVLRNYGSPSTWEGPRRTWDCRSSLDRAGTAVVTWWDNWGGYTSAQGAAGRVCVDLYYNGSSSSGWQRCHTFPTTWEG